ncbi:hypothetical protein ABID25_003995 [Mesorhizobium abyssinicae]
MTFRIGIISDTHGLLRPEAERRLAGVDHIIHGGDIGSPEIIATLQQIAPVTAKEETSIRLGGLLPTPTPRWCGWQAERSTSSMI